MIMNLSELGPGEKARVIDIDIGIDGFDIERQRLFNLGIVEGTEIEALYKSPSGNPVAYLIRGTVLALRNETAEKIIIEI